MPRETSAGWVRGRPVILPVTAYTGVADNNTAITLLDSHSFGFTAEIEQIGFISSSIATGAGATLDFELRKGGPTGSVVGVLTLALADVNAVGKAKFANVGSVAGEGIRLRDTDTFSLTRKATGTAFTKLEGAFVVVLRQRAQSKL